MTDIKETAALYAAGALDEKERAAFEERLRSGDAEAVAEMESLGQAVEALASSAPPVEPAPAIRENLMDRVRKDAGQFFLLRAGEGKWEETGVEGVQRRILFTDEKSGRQTLLSRMAPGTSFPAHPHAGVEECLVLEGDRVSEGRTLVAGDYQRMPADATHGETRSVNGCLALLILWPA